MSKFRDAISEFFGGRPGLGDEPAPEPVMVLTDQRLVSAMKAQLPLDAQPKPLPLAPALTGTGPALPTPHHTATAADSVAKLLPLWQCHKIVRAAAIADMHGAIITLDLGGGKRTQILVDPKMFARYTPAIGDYVVVYDGDGYMAFSPKATFDSGYFRL
jgi:hypothetical protein